MTNVADQQIVNFTVSGVNYGVPVDQVREVRDVQSVIPVPGSPDFVMGISNLRGQLISVMDLQKRLNLDETDGGGGKIIIVEMEDHSVGIIVDTVTDVSLIPGADIEGNLEFTTEYESYVIGVGKQNENLVVILNLTNVIRDVVDQLPGKEALKASRSKKSEKK